MTTRLDRSSDVNSQVPRKVAFRVLPILALLYMFNYMDRANIAYAQIGMSVDIGVTTAAFGLASSIFFLAYVVFEIPSNVVLKIVGARIWFARIAITWGIAAALTSLVGSPTQLVVARVILGIAEAGLFPGALFYLTLWFRKKERVRALAILAVAQPVALIIGSSTAGLILDHVHWFGLSSWRWIFILQGLPAVILGVVVYFTLPDRPSKARFLNAREAEWLTAQVNSERPSSGVHGFRGQLRVVGSRTILHMAFTQMLIASGLYGLAFFLPLIVKQLDPTYSSTRIGFLGALPYLVGAIAMLLISRNSDRTGDRKGHVIACVVIAAGGLFGAIQFAEVTTAAMLCLTLAAVGVLGYIAPYFAMVSEALPKESAAIGLAFVNAVAAIGGFIGPFAIGAFATDDDVTGGLYFAIGALVLAAVLVVILKVERVKPHDPLPT